MHAENTTNSRSVPVAIRTLLAAGYIVTGSQRHPTHIEIPCHRISRFGVELRFLVAVSVGDEFSVAVADDIRRTATADLRAPVFVGAFSTDQQIGWNDFLEALGGAVPSWRALASSFRRDLLTTARNELPQGGAGAAWAVFEDLVADGFEFCFGRKVRRLGARRPGSAVSDMLAQLPDGALMVIDAKGARAGFDATWPSLRALVEYVRNQQQRQRGHNEVFGAVLVSSEFKQDEQSLSELSKRFLGETSAALAIATADHLADMVDLLRDNVGIRNALKWRHLLSGGVIECNSLEKEIQHALSQRFERGE